MRGKIKSLPNCPRTLKFEINHIFDVPNRLETVSSSSGAHSRFLKLEIPNKFRQIRTSILTPSENVFRWISSHFRASNDFFENYWSLQ